MTRFAAGLWRWTTYYEEWRATVGCVYFEASDAIVVQSQLQDLAALLSSIPDLVALIASFDVVAPEIDR